MARRTFTRNSAGLQRILQSTEMHRLVQSAAEKVKENVEGLHIAVDGIPGKYALPVEVSVTTTDRAHANVTLAHPSGRAVQAKHGALTKAAAQAGLEVKGGAR